MHETHANINACSETLIGSLMVERLHGERFATIREAKDAVLAWLLWYSPTRLRSMLGYHSPAVFKQQWLGQQAIEREVRSHCRSCPKHDFHYFAGFVPLLNSR